MPSLIVPSSASRSGDGGRAPVPPAAADRAGAVPRSNRSDTDLAALLVLMQASGRAERGRERSSGRRGRRDAMGGSAR